MDCPCLIFFDHHPLSGLLPLPLPPSCFSSTMIRFDQLPPEVTQAMCTPMHLILPSSSPSSGSLYLGSLSAVLESDYLRNHHITHIVQVMDAPWTPLSEKDGFNTYRIQLLDESSADIRPHLEAACAHIDKTLRSGKNVLVHCQQVRSPSSLWVNADGSRAYLAAHPSSSPISSDNTL